MNIIKINNTDFEVISYSKTTSLNGNIISSSAYCAILTNNIEALHALMEETITSIQILHNNEVIYNLSNLHANINNINEYLEDDHMGINLNLVFDNNIPEEV